MNLKKISSINMLAYHKIRNMFKTLKFMSPYKKAVPNQETETSSTSNKDITDVSTPKNIK